MAADFNLGAYFDRIGYAGNADPCFDTLETIHLCHTRSIAFENLNPLLGWPVALDVASLQQKMLRERRGGYCFEQNLLARYALQAMGFRVAGLAARVVYGLPEGVTLPRTHTLLRVESEGKAYLVDVGFGGLTLTTPLRLECDVEQSTSHEPYRLLSDGASLVMQARIAGVWKPLYQFTLEEATLSDYEMMNWYVATHPESRFVQNLIAARPDHGVRFALFNDEFAMHHLDGGTERCVFSTVAELRKLLEDPFRLSLPNGPQLDVALGRIIEKSHRLRVSSSVPKTKE